MQEKLNRIAPRGIVGLRHDKGVAQREARFTDATAQHNPGRHIAAVQSAASQLTEHRSGRRSGGKQRLRCLVPRRVIRRVPERLDLSRHRHLRALCSEARGRTQSQREANKQGGRQQGLKTRAFKARTI